ncbi:MAG: hypothetical protein JSU91_01960 [Thermoplasmatales archaeon]|nr:MAG: hypothetical protein JSU91_01960 [Thermoplasmatales archaeon]
MMKIKYCVIDMCNFEILDDKETIIKEQQIANHKNERVQDELWEIKITDISSFLIEAALKKDKFEMIQIYMSLVHRLIKIIEAFNETKDY